MISKTLADIAENVRSRRILSLFDDDDRFDAFSAEADGLLLDYSKTNVDHATRNALVDLIEAKGLATRRPAMFAGERINQTEDRAVLHTALRASDDAELMLDGVDVLDDVRKTRERMFTFAEDLRGGLEKGATGKAFRDVVNIGIGGSDLGPAMACAALAPYADGPNLHFVSNIDAAHISDTLAGLDPETTLFVIASKTFTTIETMTNAKTALHWLEAKLGDQAGQHLVAISSDLTKTAAFGIAPERVFGFADWVGGRYSLWGPIGLPILLAIGKADFAAFLAGARAMDTHFQTAVPSQNLPVLMAAIGIWHHTINGYSSRAILPYDQHLNLLPAYLQQLDMESNGKSVKLDGSGLDGPSGPIVWGQPGTNGQHAFYQLLHQGSHIVPAEFLIAREGHEPDLAHHHRLLQANCLAQSEALMRGRSADETRKMLEVQGKDRDLTPHQTFPGNRPSITLCYPKLTPFVLGQIIALYEHRVFVEGVVWGINSFDQFGVELGKVLAVDIEPLLVKGAGNGDHDGSTNGLIARLGAR